MSPSARPAELNSLWRYGALGFALAFAALPLYIHLPNHYAREWGVSLSAMGLALMLTRCADAWTDILWGPWIDRLWRGGERRFWAAMLAAAAVLFGGMVLLFFPPEHLLIAALIVGTTLATQAHSLLTIAHQSWGLRLGGSVTRRSRIASWREGFNVLGVVTASALPLLLGWPSWALALGLGLALGLWAWSRGPRPPVAAQAERTPTGRWRRVDGTVRRLLGIQALHALANAVAAGLVLFFIQDVLQAPEHQATLLLLYFAAAIASLPLWLRWIARWGLWPAWLAGSTLAIVVFLWASRLGAGEWLAFAVICVGSGLAIGADLAVPTAWLAGHLARQQQQQHSAGTMGWWNLVNKLALAASAGLALPLLAAMGYHPGATEPSALQALTLCYAVLPLLLKATALGLMWHWRSTFSTGADT